MRDLGPATTHISAMPDYEAFMLPLLKTVADRPITVFDAADRVAHDLDLSAETRALQPSWSHEPLLVARTRMAAESLAAAHLVERQSDQLAILPRGQTLLHENPHSLTRESLRRFPEFETYLQAFLARQGA